MTVSYIVETVHPEDIECVLDIDLDKATDDERDRIVSIAAEAYRDALETYLADFRYGIFKGAVNDVRPDLLEDE